MPLGLVIHIYMIIVLLKTAIPSTLTKLLLYVQTTSEGLYTILVIVQLNTRNFTPVSNRVPVNPILCYVFQGGAASVSLRVTLYGNILCQSVDRFLALVYPKTYRAYTKYYVTFYVAVIPVYSLVVSIARFVKTSLNEGSCHLREIPINPYLIPIIETLFRYVIPTSILIPINAAVIRKIRQLQPKFGSSNGGHSLPDNGNSDATAIKKSTNAVTSLQKSLFVNTICVTIQLTIIECAFFTLTVLNFSDILRYEAGAVSRLYFMSGVVLLDSLNPVVNMITINALRNTVINDCRFIWKFYQKIISIS